MTQEMADKVERQNYRVFPHVLPIKAGEGSPEQVAAGRHDWAPFGLWDAFLKYMDARHPEYSVSPSRRLKTSTSKS